MPKDKKILKEYITANFGGQAPLAEILNLSHGAVRNAISKNDDVSWLNLLYYLAELERLSNENLNDKQKDILSRIKKGETGLKFDLDGNEI